MSSRRRYREDPHFRPAAEALLELVRHDAIAHPGPRLGALLAEGEVRSALHALAARHGLLAAVLVGLQAAARRDPALAQRCAPLLAQLPGARKHAMLWDLETDRLLRLLAEAGLSPVTLKGAALRASIYSDSVQRSFGDVDLLLPPEQIDPAVAALRAAGYALGDEATVERFARQHFHHVLSNAMGFQVELHWGLVQPGSVAQLTPERILGRSIEVKRSGGPAMRIPSPEDMVLHLASQEIEDWFSSIRRIVDVDRVVRGAKSFDWTYLGSAAGESRLQPLLGFTLQLARRVFATPVPDGFVPSLGISRAARFHLSLLDPVHCVLSGYSRRRPSAARGIALCLSPDGRAGWKTIREIAADRYDTFSAERTGGPVSAASRGMVSLVKLAVLFSELYLRRGVAVILQSSRRGGDFWREGD
jgi:hypothetical protein